MKNSTFENRTKGVTKNSKCYQFAKRILTDGQKLRPCRTSGSGRFTINLDYTADTIYVLELAGLKQGVHFITGNDSPRGGKTGNFIELTSKGSKKKIK